MCRVPLAGPSASSTRSGALDRRQIETAVLVEPSGRATIGRGDEDTTYLISTTATADAFAPSTGGLDQKTPLINPPSTCSVAPVM